MDEHTRIARFFAPLSIGEPGAFSLTDDAAALAPPPGKQLVFTTDSMIEGRHVLRGATPQQMAQKLVRRNLSDLAAMGAQPWRYLLNLHTPRGLSDDWFAEFATALAEEQTMFGMLLIGGDSTSGAADAPIHSTLTCIGLSDHAPLTRYGAKPGDGIYVSGTMGDAALGLCALQQHWPSGGECAALIARYHCPEPRIDLGLALHGIAHAVMDISDGLIADLRKLCALNRVGFTLQQSAIPLSAAAQYLIANDSTLWQTILTGGDDYELLFTAPESVQHTITALSTSLALPLSKIGVVTEDSTTQCLDVHGHPLQFSTIGWSHT